MLHVVVQREDAKLTVVTDNVHERVVKAVTRTFEKYDVVQAEQTDMKAPSHQHFFRQCFALPNELSLKIM